MLAVAIAGALFGPVLGGLAAVLGTGPVFTGSACWPSESLLRPSHGHAAEGRPCRSRTSGALSTTGGSSAALWLVALPALMFGTLTVLVPLRFRSSASPPRRSAPSSSSPVRLEAALSPVMGRLSDRRGKRYPITIGLVASAVATLPSAAVAQQGLVLAVVTVLAACAFGVFWAPAMSLLSDTSERIGLDVAWGFALANLAWAPGQATGAAVGGTLARRDNDALPYLLLAGCCLATLAAVRSA